MFFCSPHQCNSIDSKCICVPIMQRVVHLPAQSYQVPRLVCVLGVFIRRVDVMDYLSRYALAVSLRELTHVIVPTHDCVG